MDCCKRQFILLFSYLVSKNDSNKLTIHYLFNMNNFKIR